MKTTSPHCIPLLVLLSAILVCCHALPVAAQQSSADTIPATNGEIKIHPINHATLALQWKGATIFVDPVGGSKPFANLPKPGLILITDIHGDHLSAETLTQLATSETKLVAPPAVVEKLPGELRGRAITLEMGQTQEVLGMRIQAIPAYNLAEDRQKFHAKDRGVGFVLTLGGKRVYISGDTEDIPEMLALKDIDVAFLCMNLPYTMTEEQAARAVRTFKPKIVYPYHYRGSDLAKFKQLVGADSGVEVRLREWYPKQ